MKRHAEGQGNLFGPGKRVPRAFVEREPYSRPPSNETDTSRQAAVEARKRSTAHRIEIMGFMAAAGERGATCLEAATVLGIPLQGARARFRELELNGALVMSERTRMKVSRSKRRHHVYFHRGHVPDGVEFRTPPPKRTRPKKAQAEGDTRPPTPLQRDILVTLFPRRLRTYADLVRIVHRTVSGVSTALTHLQRKGLVVDSGKRAMTEFRRRAILFKLTPEGRRWVEGNVDYEPKAN